MLAFSLRTAVGSLSPVLVLVESDFEVPAAVAGLIGTAPPVCYATFGILAPLLERKLGLERLVVAMMTIIAAGLAARGLAANAAELLAFTAVIFGGIGIANVL